MLFVFLFALTRQMLMCHRFLQAGVEGSGKSAMLAKLASTLTDGKATVVTRFLGTSSNSTNLLDTMQSVVFQIVSAYEQELTFPESVEDLKAEFERSLKFATAEAPLFLLLDGVDR